MKNYYFILFITSILSAAILAAGCYTYFPISKNDVANSNPNNKIKIILNDKREFVVNDLTEIDYSNPDKIIIPQNDSTKLTFSLTEVERISEERFDLGKTFFSTMWITIGVFVVLAGILFITTGGKGLSVG